MRELSGRVAVVTGAAAGIGLGISRSLAGAGMRIVLADIDAVRLEATAAEMRADGADVIAVRTDVRHEAEMIALRDAALEAYGAVHVICNNAGVWSIGSQWETSTADWKWVVDVNLWGVIHGIRAFVPILLGNPDGGHVVNTSSIGGLVGGGLTGPYTATKHAVVGMSKGLRAELNMLGSSVGVSVVCPGRVTTGILDHVNTRPEGGVPSALSSQAAEIVTAMRSAQQLGLSEDEAGRMVREAIEQNRFWVLPGAIAHHPMVQREFDDLLAAFG